MLKTLPIALLVFAPLSLFSQIEFGLKLGGNISHVNGEDAHYQVKNRMSTQSALVLSYAFKKIMALRTELGIYHKGGKVDFTENGYLGWTATYTGSQKINYLVLPLYADFRIPLAANHQVILSIGAYMASGINGKMNITKVFTDPGTPSHNSTSHYEKEMEFTDVVTYRESDPNATQVIRDYGFVKRRDYGVSVGGGYRYKQVMINFACDMGLANINAHLDNVIDEEIKKKNRTLQLSVTYFPVLQRKQ
jgi:hypothetical protein